MRRAVSAQLLALTVSFLSYARDNQRGVPDEISGPASGCKSNSYSVDKEIALGKQLTRQVERRSKIVDDPTMVEYLSRIGQTLAHNSGIKVPITIKVIEDPSVNAFVLPGGFLYLQTGLIFEADSEAELAGAMAHEIALVASRAGLCQVAQGEAAQLATIPLIYVGGPAAYGVCDSGGLVPRASLESSRSMQAEADSMGIQYIYNSGYDPAAIVDFLEKHRRLEKRTPEKVSTFFSVPPTEDRIVKSQLEISALKVKPRYVVTTSAFDETKKRLAVTRRSLAGETSK